MTSQLVDLAIPVHVPSTFHYLLDAELGPVEAGSVVEVAFGTRTLHGFVLGFPQDTSVDASKLKSVQRVLIQQPLLDATMLRFLRWVSEYYCHPLGEVFAAAVPKAFITASDSRKDKAVQFEAPSFAPPSEVPQLTAFQQRALDQLEQADRPALLHGVTGSGKTEVYIRALQSVVATGRTGMILVPEIALTPQLVGRFSSRFPGQVAVLHSDLTPKERLGQWERLRRGLATIVIGARSAVFAPVRNLGLIIVDEEHETSFKQEDLLRYHARDVAVVRGKMAGARVILGSATPSLESYANAQSGRYCYVVLPERVHRKPLPKVTTVDLREKTAWQDPSRPWLSQVLFERIQRTLAANQQSLLYLNRLGFAHFLYCGDCGHTWRCRQCDVSLTYYQKPPKLQCHYCNSSYEVPLQCEVCQGAELSTLGVGTEQVEKDLKALLPTARIARMDRAAIRTRTDLETVLRAVSERQVDIVIGTQMLAKGHDFPGIALVGILMADATLNMPDFRANERTFQVITQVSGRAGRGEIAGEVVLQTFNPEAPILRQAIENDAKAFYQSELQARRMVGFPPDKRLAMLRFQHKNPQRVREFAERVMGFLITRKLPVQVLGPAEAPLSRLKNLYRWHGLIKSDTIRDLQQAIDLATQYGQHLKSGVQMAVDVDPVNCM